MSEGTTLKEAEGAYESLAWEPETPFVSDVVVPAGARTAAASSAARAFAQMPELESPFVSEYAGEEWVPGPEAELFASLVGELYDPEFEEALEDLVNEAAGIAEEQLSFEYEDPAQQRLEMERALREYLQPLERAAEAMLDRMAAGLGDKDLSQLSEGELEAVLDQFAPAEPGLSPTFEHILGGVFKKAKKFLKGAAKAVGKFMPAAIILNRLKGLVRPLLARVLRHAIDKLPVTLRPIAQQLGKRLLGIATPAAAAVPAGGGGEGPASGAEPADAAGEPAAADPADIQGELDTQLAGYLVQGEEFERAAAIEQTLADQATPIGDPIRELERARADFARQVIGMDEGEDPRPEVEQFVPAILMALKIGIKVMGRPRVVRFLAGLVAKLISKYVGRQPAIALSRSLVDVGLRSVSLEAVEEEEPVAAGYALASTVEDTVNRLVQMAPQEAWESEALLEGYVAEAFQRAASAHFPDPLIRPDLHEAARASGAWVPLPSRTARKLYKKYTRIVDVTITPQVAAAVKTFRGIALRDFLKNRLGLAVEGPVRARVHLYEAISGTRLGLIALFEKKVPGLGSSRREARSLIHPLTAEAAGLLLNEPGLGRPVDPQFLARRGKVAVGQRFYYLEIPGARVRMAPRSPGNGARPARSSQTSVVLDFPKGQLRVFVYYSEADAQELATQFRRGLPISALLMAMRAKVDVSLPKILSGDQKGGVRVIHEAMPTEQLVNKALGAVGKELAEALLKWLLEALRRELEARKDRFFAEFERAQKAEADGVTVVVLFQAPSAMGALRRAFPLSGAIPGGGLLGLLRQTISEYKLEIRPGFAYW